MEETQTFEAKVRKISRLTYGLTVPKRMIKTRRLLPGQYYLFTAVLLPGGDSHKATEREPVSAPSFEELQAMKKE